MKSAGHIARTFMAVGCMTAAAWGGSPPQPSIGLMSKVILDVSHKEVGKEWEKARRGEPVSSGDKVLTGEKSLAIIKFKDNSMVRVREKTELTLTGNVQGGSFSKSVRVDQGVIGFNVQKQRSQEEFRFTSPTSVASIRGTGGLFAARSAADTLIVIEGLVRLTNTVSSNEVDVPDGFTGISRADGHIEARPSTPQERAAAFLASRMNDQENKLELELRDGKGNQKQFRIDFRE